MKLGEAVRLLRKYRGMTLSEVANLMSDYDAGNLSKFERSELGMKPHNIDELAQTLGVNTSTLYAIAETNGKILEEAPEKLLQDYNVVTFMNNATVGPKLTGKVPLISSVQAGNWMQIKEEVLSCEATEWIHTAEKVSEKAFALKIQGDSMTNPYSRHSLPEGVLIVVDPEVIPVNRSIVVVRNDDDDSALVKQLVIEGSTKYLKPLNPQYPIIQMDDSCILVGTAINAVTELPR